MAIIDSEEIYTDSPVSNGSLPISETPLPVIAQFSSGAVGSTLAVVLLIISRHQHQWHYFYTFFMGLSLTDLSLYFFIYPVATRRYVSKYKWSMTEEYCQFMSFWYVLSVMNTACLICAMSVGRFKSVFFSNSETYVRNDWRRPLAIVIIIWFLCAIFSYLQLVGIGKWREYYPGSYCYLDYRDQDINRKVYSMTYAVIGLTLVSITVILNVISIIYLCINVEGRRRLLDDDLISGFYDWHSIAFLTIVIFIFAGLWGPHTVFIIITQMKLVPYNAKMEIFCFRLAVVNNIINPWVYVILRRENLQKARSLLLRLQYGCCRGRNRINSPSPSVVSINEDEES